MTSMSAVDEDEDDELELAELFAEPEPDPDPDPEPEPDPEPDPEDEPLICWPAVTLTAVTVPAMGDVSVAPDRADFASVS